MKLIMFYIFLKNSQIPLVLYGFTYEHTKMQKAQNKYGKNQPHCEQQILLAGAHS